MFYVYVDRFYSHQDIFEAAEIVTNGHGDLIPRDVALQVMVFDKTLQLMPLNSNIPATTVYISKTEDARGWDISIGPFRIKEEAFTWRQYLCYRGYNNAALHSYERERQDFLVWY